MNNKSPCLLSCKKLAIVFFITTLTIFSAMVSDAETIIRQRGRYVFADIKSNDLYLLDTNTGRFWKNSGTASKPATFVPVKYVDSKGNLISEPEETAKADQYEGRFQFKDIYSDDWFMLDKETGNVWRLEGAISNPKKLVPIKVER